MLGAMSQPTARAARDHLRDLLTDTMQALGFLTRLRLDPRWFEGFDGRYDRAARAFPIAGLLATVPGALVLGCGVLVGLTPIVAAALGVAVTLLVTGALHEDGLADTFDGLGGADRERRLAIMRDHATGAYGALALVVSVVLRIVLLAELAVPGLAIPAWLAAAALGRAAMVWLWARSEGARADGAASGAGQPDDVALRTAVIAGAVLALPALVLLGPLPLVAALVLLALVVLWLRRSVVAPLGGHTGDVLGAVAVLGEIAVLTGLAIG